MANCCKDIAWSEAEDALVAELELVDIPVDIVRGEAMDESTRRDELERIAHDKGAAAAVRLIKSQRDDRAGVELWIVDRVTGKTTYRRLDVDSSYDAAATIDVAIRVVEALRASLLELRMTGRRAPPKETMTPEIVELVETTPIERDAGLFGLGATSALNISPGGTGPRGAFSIAPLLHPALGLDIELSVLFSPIGRDIETENDISTFDYVMVTGGFFYRFLRRAMVQPALGLKGGALIAWTSGHTREGEKLLTDSETVAYIGGGARIFMFPNQTFDLYLGAEVGITLPEIRARHGETPAARFGRPFVGISLGAQFRFI